MRYSINLFAAGVNDFDSAILRAKGDSRYPFIALTITGFINVCLNFFFVVIRHWGVIGVAIATAITYSSTVSGSNSENRHSYFMGDNNTSDCT